uniref:Signal transducer and activator of transcription n=1 Tax=Xenopus tropicalis TaxID=8364 RepID=A0A6I8S5X0_XENTR
MAQVSLWSYVSRIAPDKFENVYGEFTKEVRSLLAEYLENQPWEYVSGSDSFCLELASTLIQSLLEELRKISRNSGAAVHLVHQNIQRISKQDPVQTVLQIKHLLEKEKSVVVNLFPRSNVSLIQKKEEMQFNVQIMKLKHKLQQVAMVQQQLRDSKANMSFHNQMHDVASLHMQWEVLVKEYFQLLESAQTQALKRIGIWKRQQQLAGNGAPFDENLIPLQERMETIFAMYQDIDRLVKDFSLMGEQVPPGLPENMNCSLRTLITSSLLVDKQPPQVLKTQSKFQASVNFLLGSRLLAGAAKMPVVRATIITEKKAQELYLTSTSETWNEGAGEIENGKSVLEIAPNSKMCGAVFKNMLLKKIKRCERKGSESVTEEKCAVLFVAEFNLNSINTTFHIQALSLPVVVIVHGNQDNNAKATILWDNAFSEVERRPFFVEEKVPWPKMCHTLNMKFVSEVGTKQELQEEHFVFLAQKIFNDNSLSDNKDRMVSWTQFNKEPLRERNFTFWQWFDGVVDLTKKCLKDYWSDRLIMGFISKQYVHNILSTQPDGTFLLRFSDSEIGGITIAHILKREDGSAQIQNIQPFTAKDLNILSLGDRVRDLKQLKYLYSNKPKDDVFGRHYSKKTSKTPDGYTPTLITLKVAGGPPMFLPQVEDPSTFLQNFPLAQQGHMSNVLPYPEGCDPGLQWSGQNFIPPVQPQPFAHQEIFRNINLNTNDINMIEELQTMEDALTGDFSSSHVLGPMSIAHNTEPNWME